jgi:hypothetical protein
VIRSDDPAELADVSKRSADLGELAPATRPAGCSRRSIWPPPVEWARSIDAVVASDECYLPLGWDAEPASVLSACGPTTEGVLAVHSLSKRSEPRRIPGRLRRR